LVVLIVTWWWWSSSLKQTRRLGLRRGGFVFGDSETIRRAASRQSYREKSLQRRAYLYRYSLMLSTVDHTPRIKPEAEIFNFKQRCF
jgi:hypothetical protein